MYKIVWENKGLEETHDNIEDFLTRMRQIITDPQNKGEQLKVGSIEDEKDSQNR